MLKPIHFNTSLLNESSYDHLNLCQTDLSILCDKDIVVIDYPTIRVLYSYPFTKFGPSSIEKKCNGWLFTETSPNQVNFTRQDLFTVISERYEYIYDEEYTTSTNRSFYPESRNLTNGKYGIFGYYRRDLYLEAIYHNNFLDIYVPIISF